MGNLEAGMYYVAASKGVFRGDRLRIARDNNKLTQDDLARDLGFGETQVNKYENNKNDPSAEVIVRLAKRLNVSADWLLGLTNDPHGRADSISPEAERFITAVEAGDFTKIIEMALDNLKAKK
jgi:transcriptional regulator with XRE-family HTH domain